ncbi:hypothetical protein [Enterococcus faecalis]|uniref:hypothetical protein n=1 Tax=Enterococcus faecalis TaxID=1351 RepID=UPI00032E9B62|nr:hypothetical protein [Enterococcus faecalis]EOK18240.1 hypothetical protein WU5_02924 [Enterococcus faecalis EnGen0329]WQP96395.1 hypothetical protein U8P19_15000 [Enterococcus faecalis]STP93372.1 Uncharacterised protein [Enterococcus faecalis]HDI8269677.1 hypothetical protein [Staphylococcus aureus]
MKKDIFEAYIRSRLFEGKNSQYIIDEIEGLVSRYNQLVLYDEEDKEVVFKPFWLNNFRYKDTINRIERIIYRENS